MDRYHLNFLLIDPCPLAGTQFVEYAKGLEQTAVQLFSVAGLSAEGFTPQPNAVVYAWQVGEEAANQVALVRLRQYFAGVPLVVSTKPEGLTAVAQLKNIHSYILHPYVGGDVERLVEQIHQCEVSNRANDLHPLLAEMVANPDEPITLQRLTDLLVNRFGYDIAMCHTISDFDFLERHNYAGIVANEAIAATNKLRVGEGIVGEVARTGRARTEYDLSLHPDYLTTDLILYEGVASMFAVPLKLRQDVLGVLSCFTRSAHRFTPPEVAFLTQLANLATLEWNNAKERNRWQALENAGRDLISVQDLREAIRVTVENALGVAEASGASACFYSSDQGRFLSTHQKSKGLGRAIVDWSDKNPQWRLLRKQVLAEGPLLVPDVAAWPDLPWIQEKMLRYGVQSFVGLPLRGDELDVGILFVFYRRLHPYAALGREHAAKQPLNIYAEMAALVIERAYHEDRQSQETSMVQKWTEMTSTGLPMQGVESGFWMRLLDDVLSVTGAERGAMCLRTGGGGWRYYNRHVPKLYIETQVAFNGRSLEKMAAASKESLVLSDLRHVASTESMHLLRDADGATCELAVYHGVDLPRSRMVTPVRRGRQLMGFIILESSQPFTFNRYDKGLLNNLAQHIGIAVSYDTLMRELGDSAQKFPVIQLIRQDLMKILDRVRRKTACDVATLFLYSSYWETFQLPMSSGELRFSNTAFGFDPKKLEVLFAAETTDGFVTDLALVQSACPLFIEREEIQSVCALCLRNGRSEPIGILILHCRENRQPNPKDQQLISQTGQEMEELVERAYFSPQLVEILRDAFDFDVVRLHLFKQKENKWSSPMTAGELKEANKWCYSRSDGPITHALRAVETGDKPYRFVNNVAHDPILTRGGFVKREGICSGGYVLLEVEDEIVGILFVNWRRPHVWTEVEKNAVLIFAKQAALGVYNRRLITMLEEEGVSTNWIQRIVGAVIKAGFNQKAALDAILEQAIAITQAHFGVMRLVDEMNPDWVNTVAVDGIKGDEVAWFEQHGRVLRSGQGISLLAMRQNRRLFVRDVQAPEYANDYVEAADGHTRSEMAVVLRHMQTGEPIGVIDVEHPEPGGFSLQALERLTTFAEVASIVLHNIEKDADLMRAKEEMAHIEALAWRGMFGSNWWHTACQKTSAIKAQVLPLQKRFADDSWTLRGLKKIDELADKIEQIPEMGWVPNELEVEPEPMLVDSLVKTAVSDACRPYRHINLIWHLQSPTTRVAVHDKLFAQAIKNLVENAIRAMDRKGVLTVRTSFCGKHAHIDLIDTGPGIPADIRSIYLHQRIPKKAEPQGTGLGGYMASFVFARYKGTVAVVKSDKSGTHVEIIIPVCQEEVA